MFSDFYEPSEFDIMIEEFKDELRKSVKKEYIDRIKELEDEVKSLSDIKRNWNEKQRELTKAINDAEVAKVRASIDVKRDTLKSLLEPLKKDAWVVYVEYNYLREKCDNCDDNGYITFKSPQGREYKEQCKCRERKKHFKLKKAEVYLLEGSSTSNNSRISFIYRKNNLCYEFDDEFKVIHDVYEGQNFEDIKRDCQGYIFFDKEKGQEFCDFLNSKE